MKNETAMDHLQRGGHETCHGFAQKHKMRFAEQFGVGLGFMGFFTKAVTTALAEFPAINAQIDGKELIYHDYADVCIGEAHPRIDGASRAKRRTMSLAEIEAEIKRGDPRSRRGAHRRMMQGRNLHHHEWQVFGSMLSTPISIHRRVRSLEMHNIVERPVAINGSGNPPHHVRGAQLRPPHCGRQRALDSCA